MHVERDRCVYEDTYTLAFVQDFDGVAVEDGDTGGGVVGKAERGVERCSFLPETDSLDGESPLDFHFQMCLNTSDMSTRLHEHLA